MAAQSWDSNESINEMVGNRLIDNAAVAIAAINRAPVCVARSQAMYHKNKNGSTLFGLSSHEKFNCEWAALLLQPLLLLVPRLLLLLLHLLQIPLQPNCQLFNTTTAPTTTTPPTTAL